MSNPNDISHGMFGDMEEAWPQAIGVFCDRECGTVIEGQFMVKDQAEGFAAARKYAAEQGWNITDTEDVCPKCSGEKGLETGD